jgi:putative transposase
MAHPQPIGDSLLGQLPSCRKGKGVSPSYWTIVLAAPRQSEAVMARKLRVEYPGAIYHVMNRGDRREAIFRVDADRELFLETLGEACVKAGWQVHAYCLMGNHFHLVVETPHGNLVAGMKWFLGIYTSRFNRKHRLFGHLFSGRYKALVVDGSGDGYLQTVCEYVHLNPVRAKLLKSEQPLSAYRWSSYVEYLKEPRRRAAWLRVDRLFGEMGIGRDDAAGRRRFASWLEERRREAEPKEWKAVRRGWYYGAAELKERLLEQMGGQVGVHHGGEEVWESAEQKAERIVREELKKLGWEEAELGKEKKTDRHKVAIARRLRRETVMTVAWIGRRLQMGSRHTVANCLKAG